MTRILTDPAGKSFPARCASASEGRQAVDDCCRRKQQSCTEHYHDRRATRPADFGHKGIVASRICATQCAGYGRESHRACPARDISVASAAHGDASTLVEPIATKLDAVDYCLGVRAQLRHECVGIDKLSYRVISLPSDLVWPEMYLTHAPVPDNVLVEIVDQIFLPLAQVRPEQANSKSVQRFYKRPVPALARPPVGILVDAQSRVAPGMAKLLSAPDAPVEVHVGRSPRTRGSGSAWRPSC